MNLDEFLGWVIPMGVIILGAWLALRPLIEPIKDLFSRFSSISTKGGDDGTTTKTLTYE